MRRALAEDGIPYDRKKFSPHITLIRRALFRDRSALEIEKPPKGSTQVDRVSLMRSDRGKNTGLKKEMERGQSHWLLLHGIAMTVLYYK